MQLAQECLFEERCRTRSMCLYACRREGGTEWWITGNGEFAERRSERDREWESGQHHHKCAGWQANKQASTLSFKHAHTHMEWTCAYAQTTGSVAWLTHHPKGALLFSTSYECAWFDRNQTTYLLSMFLFAKSSQNHSFSLLSCPYPVLTLPWYGITRQTLRLVSTASGVTKQWYARQSKLLRHKHPFVDVGCKSPTHP